jgi:hypothetical protein
VRYTANLVLQRVVEPHIALGNAQCGRRPVEHDGSQAVDGQSGVRPAPTAHQVLGKVPVVAAQAGESRRVREVAYQNNELEDRFGSSAVQD